jgi:hypothetical protein
MHVTMTGVLALEQLRTQLEEDAGADYPQQVRTELLMLYDVCRSLNLGLFQMREVMGEPGWAFVRAELDAPVGLPTSEAFRVLAASPAPLGSAPIR